MATLFTRIIDGELPGPPQSRKGWLAFGQLPNEFRGDSAELPVIAWRTAVTVSTRRLKRMPTTMKKIGMKRP